jgi:hypothetical protein
MHRPETKGGEHFIQHTWPINQINENQYIQLNGEFCETILCTISAICGVKTEHSGLKPNRKP